MPGKVLDSLRQTLDYIQSNSDKKVLVWGHTQNYLRFMRHEILESLPVDSIKQVRNNDIYLSNGCHIMLRSRGSEDTLRGLRLGGYFMAYYDPDVEDYLRTCLHFE